ncbi:MAG TPA: hypothetical protein VK752_20425 [Bryobacteraceae bacterium]|jgi:hypothetical protein|nr:hypothetical protein [Bryobacteraceae bacterium]
MELVERYLQAVQFWLPRGQKDDIIAELSEDLHAQIEEKEAGLGRKLTDVEVEAILRQRGRPVLVANRFLPRDYLIGPVLFPIYMFVLKIVMLGYVVPWILVWIGMMIYSPGYRVQHAAHSWLEAFGYVWSSLWGTAFLAAGTVTVVFAVLERVQKKSGFLEKWDPHKLPPLRNPNVITRPSAFFELVINALGVVVWVTNMYSPVTMISEVRISVSPLWPWFFWGFLLVSLVNTALAAVNLTRPFWTTQRAIVRLLSDATGSALFCWLLKANILTGFAVAGMSLERTAEITQLINYWVGRAFPIAVAIGVAVLCGNIYRLVRLKTGRTHPALQAIAH